MPYVRTPNVPVQQQLLDAIEYEISAGIKVTGITFDKDIDIGDISILNVAGTKVNPATSENIQSLLDGIAGADSNATTLKDLLDSLAALPTGFDDITGSGSNAKTLNDVVEAVGDIPAVNTEDITGTGSSARTLADIDTAIDSLVAALATVEAVPTAAAVVVAAGPTATALGSGLAYGLSFTAKTTNLSNILYGSQASQIIPVSPGATVNLGFASNVKVDLAKLFINGTAGEGVDILSYAPPTS